MKEFRRGQLPRIPCERKSRAAAESTVDSPDLTAKTRNPVGPVESRTPDGQGGWVEKPDGGQVLRKAKQPNELSPSVAVAGAKLRPKNSMDAVPNVVSVEGKDPSSMEPRNTGAMVVGGLSNG